MDWFQLEVYDLLPAFLDWYKPHDPQSVARIDNNRAVEAYRRIREQVHTTGIEQDAATCLQRVLCSLELEVASSTLELGLETIMRRTLPDASPMHGAVETVRAIAARDIPIAVVSSAIYHPFLEWTLEQFGILRHFELVVTSADCGYYKSTPRIYDYVLDCLGRPNGRCVHIGDSTLYDVQSAHAAGMNTVWVNWDGIPDDNHQADLVVPTLEGLPELLFDCPGSEPC